MKLRGMIGALGLGLGLLLTAGAGLAAEPDQEVRFETGLGYDSNVFLAPDKGFFNPFSNALIEPRRKSGLFVPVSARAERAFDLGRPTLTPALFFQGRFYPGLRDADNHWLNFDADLELPLRKQGPYQDRLVLTPSIAYNREIYVDRETGLERLATTTQESLADRFSYVRYGVEAALRVRTTPVKYALKARLRQYDYEEVPVLDPLDYRYYLLGAEGAYELVRGTILKLGVDYTVRDFDRRRARDLDGDPADGTDRRYTYYDVGLELEQKLARDWTLELGYHRLERRDNFVGYDDYSRNAYSSGLRYRDRERRLLKGKLTYWNRDYPRAFAFDQRSAVEPGSGRIFLFPGKEYQTWEMELRGELPLPGWRLWGGHWALWGEGELIDQQSSDPRFDYRRQLISAGIKLTL